MSPTRYNVLGVGISTLTLDSAVALLLQAKAAGRRGYVCCGTAHGLVEAQRDSELRRAYNDAWLTTPDGMPLVWLGPRGVSRVYGPDLMLAACDAGRARGVRHLLFGGREGVASALRDRLVARYPGLEIVAALTPAVGEVDAIDPTALFSSVRETRPDLVWVGLGSPKQELFMARHWPALASGVMIGVGAAFDFHSGRVRQAPRWIRGSGFEWLFRFAMEPRRLGWRYLRTNPLFLAHVVAQRLRPRRYTLDAQ